MDDLSERWQNGWSALTLPGSCPNCDHNGAFESLRVPKEVATDLGDRHLRLETTFPPSELPGTYPTRWVVTCKCGHADHGEDGGCGRSGHVPIPRVT